MSPLLLPLASSWPSSLLCLISAVALHGSPRPVSGFWLDLVTAEPVAEPSALWQDLRSVQVVFVGEVHQLPRHHALQCEILDQMRQSDHPVILALEQLEARYQPQIDEFNSGTHSFVELAEAINWPSFWSNYQDYQKLMTQARAGGVRVIGLNGPLDLIRKIGRQGLAGLSAEEKMLLPAEIQLEDPVYEQLMNKLLSVHANFPRQALRQVFEAQVVRDELMAANLVQAADLAMQTLDLEKPPSILVITGAGHVRWGLGCPDRVSRRRPQWEHRIVLLSESGELVLTPQQQKMQADVEFQHRDFRFIQRSVGDYLHVKPLADTTKEPLSK